MRNFKVTIRKDACFGIGVMCLILSSHLKADEISNHRLYRSAHYLGRGDTGIGDSDKHHSIFYNPAGLAMGSGIYKESVFFSPRVEVSSSTKDLVRQVAVEKQNDPRLLRNYIGKNQHLGVSNFTGIVFRRAAIGIVVNSSVDALLYKSPTAGATETLSAQSLVDQVLTFSFAEKIASNLALGSTLKYYQQQTYASLGINVVDANNVANQLESSGAQSKLSGYGGDIGLSYGDEKLPFAAGLTIENVGQTSLSTIDSSDKRIIKQTLNLGLSYKVKSNLSQFNFLFDIRDLGSNIESNILKKINLGSEISIGSFAGLSAGLQQGYPSFGLWMDLYLFRTDLAMYTQEMGSYAGARPDSRYVLQMSLKI